MVSTTISGRARDTQRQKLYDAEDILKAGVWQSKAALRLLDNGLKVKSTGNVSIEACQAYVDWVTARAWFQRRWGQRHILVQHKVYGSATGGEGRMALPPWSRNEVVILHEITHSLVPSSAASHGPEFAATFLFLVDRVLGSEAKAALLEEFRKRKIRRAPSAVPAPTRQV